VNYFKRTTRKETRTESSVVETMETMEECGASGDWPAMMRTPWKSSPGAVHWDYLKTFEIQTPPAASVGGVAEARLFANAKQQMPIIVVLSPRLTGGEYVGHLIPKKEILDRLTLVNYNDGSPLPDYWHVDKERSTDGYVWDQSYISLPADKTPDDYAPGSKDEWPRPSIVYANDQLEVTIYVRAEGPVKNTSVRAAASIVPPGATQPIQTRPGSSGGSSEFDSSVIISARPSPIVTTGGTEYPDSLTIKAEPVRWDNDWNRARDWTITLRLMGKIVPLKSAYASGLETMWWDDGSWGPWEFTFVTTAQPGSTVPVLGGLPARVKTDDGDYDFPTSRWFPSPHVVNYPAKMSFLMINSSEDYHFYYSNGAKAPQNWTTYWKLTDEAGNTYPVRVDIDHSQWDVLRISSWSGRESTPVPGARHERRETPESPRCFPARKMTEIRRTESSTVETIDEWSETLPAPPGCSQASFSAHCRARERKRLAETAWSKLTVFRVDPVSRPVIGYPGETKTGVEVTLAAVDASGVPVTIPDDELTRILTLVDYETGLALPATWEVSPAKPESDSKAELQVFVFWVSSTVPCPSPASVAASITPPGGLPPIQTRPGDSGGGGPGFDSKVQLHIDPDPRWSLSRLEISGVSLPKVYANGLQQFEAKIELAFTDLVTGQPGELTTAELESLTVAFADGGAPLPADAEGATGWCVSQTHKGYKPYPVPMPAESDGTEVSPPSRASTFHTFFLANRGGRQGTMPLCAYVKSRDGWTYLSNGDAFDPCGKLHDSETSRLEATAVDPVEGTKDQYPVEVRVLSGDLGREHRVPSDPASVHHYRVSFNDKDNNVVGFRSVKSTPAGMIQWNDKVPGEHRACYTGYAAPGSAALIWEADSSVPAGPSPKPTLPAPVPDQISILLVGRANIPYASGKQNGPMVLTAVDGYGNTHTLYIGFESPGADGRWKLVLTK